MAKRQISRLLLVTSLGFGSLTQVSSRSADATTLDRMGGADRYETAVMVARRVVAEGMAGSTVLLTTGENYPDAISAGGWQGKAAVVLTKRQDVPASSLDLLKETWVREVFVIGGPSVIADSVIDRVRSLGKSVTRLWGENRFETSVEVSKVTNGPKSVKKIWLAPGNSFSDQLVAAAAARRSGGAFLIVPESGVLSSITTNEINRLAGEDTELRVVDHRSQLTEMNLTRLSRLNFNGDPYEITVDTQAVSQTTIVASGENWPDALGGTRLVSASRGMILTRQSCAPPGVSTRLQGADRLIVLGGQAALSSASVRGTSCPAPPPASWVTPPHKSNIHLSVGMTRSIEYLATRAHLLTYPGQAVSARVTDGTGKCVVDSTLVRATAAGKCILEVRVAGASRTMTVNVVAQPQRTSTDRPGPALLDLKPVYIRFSDSPDMARDTNGQIASFVQGISDFMASQHPGFALRVDTTNGVPDVQHIVVPITTAEFLSRWAAETDRMKANMGPLGPLLIDMGFDPGIRGFYSDGTLGQKIDQIKRIYVGIVEAPHGPYRSPNSNIDGGCSSSSGNAFVVYFVRELDGTDCTVNQAQQMTYRGSTVDWIGFDAFRLLVDLLNGNRDCDRTITNRYAVPLDDRPNSITSPNDPIGYPYAVGSRFPKVLDPFRRFYFRITSGPFAGDPCTDLLYSSYLTEWSSTDAHDDRLLGRSTRDLPDDVDGPQVRVLYVLPSNAPDHQWDVNGFLHETAASANEWLFANGGRSVRFDTFRERLDVGFVRLPMAEQDLWFRPDGSKCSPNEMCPDPRRLMDILDGLDVLSDGKIHIVVWGGQLMPASVRHVGCAGAMPDRNAVFMSPMLRISLSSQLGCLSSAVTEVPSSFNSLGLVMIHEIFHVFGGVDNGAPDADGGFHIGNDPSDLMGGSSGIVQLDPRRRNYWEHGRSNLLDLSKDPHLVRGPSTLERPSPLVIPRPWWLDYPQQWNPLQGL